jgi:nucleotide-binding universal stress UspA family protein
MYVPRKTAPLNILLGIDGSDHSQAAVKLLSDLPIAPGSKIWALSVFSPRQLEKHASLKEALERTKDTFEKLGWDIDIELKTGNPAETLLNYAEYKQINLIVMGAVGLRATLGILLGGVAQQVVEYGHWPVLVVRAPYNGIKKVLYATDGSECSQVALQFITNFPFPKEAQIHLIHVLPPVTPVDLATSSMMGGVEPIPVFPPIPTEEETNLWQKEEEAKGQAILEQSQKSLRENHIDTQITLVKGDAATEIIAYARHNQVDLIISGSRGLSSVAGWMLGSVSRKLIHYSACSVLVVRGNK